MSEEICPKCGNPLPECTCGLFTPKTLEEKVEDHKDVTVHLVHEKGKGFEKDKEEMSKEELARKLEEYESIIELQATAEFDKEKAKVLEKLPEDKRAKWDAEIGDNPEILEELKRNLELREAFEKPNRNRYSAPAPAGRSTIPSRETQTRTSRRDPMLGYIDDLFRKTKSNNPEEKAEAERQIEGLYESYERGQATPEAKEARRNMPLRRGSQRQHNIESFSVTQCRKCGSVITGRDADLFASRKIPCPFCGYEGGIIRKPVRGIV